MTVDEAARILRQMYRAGATKDGGQMVTGIHLFGIQYADDISHLNIKDILRQVGMPESYHTEIRKGMKLAEYVEVVKDFL